MKTIAVLPAYNAEKTLEKTLSEIPPKCFDEIILVDDCSKDGTYELALKLGIKAMRHEKNKGYGGNQKTCYSWALKEGADIVVMIHPDYQYNSRVAPLMVELIKNGVCDIVLGNRIRTRKEALSGGMPLYKYISNRALTFIENLSSGQNLGEWHSGLRAYSRRALETLNWELNSDDFVFDTQFLLSAAHAGLKLGDIPVEVRYFSEASSINFNRSVAYGLSSVGVLFRYFLHDFHIWKYPILKQKRQ
ncbi:MAG: glycosyltransferase family 2 protein [Elusimicrobia bacterium]|nr:glycosyltransferase family 2 protein [Elusimicrobiota bacterium]